ncbi:uclacyanin 1-like [Asparagus officinalis]|uniref:uclacyanin 1-like n=1 Tax=Asparagus officinalis TaxID=4686 RepID=UPI00098E2006|nr:uclacyanin 1-like [Asparagus officinalis]
MDYRKQMLNILAIVFTTLPALARGTGNIVVDHYGWTLGFSYSARADGKEFRVGNTLGKHNVFKVNGPDFMACIAPSESEEMATVFKYASDKVGGPECEHCSVQQENEAMATRNDVVRLATPGKRWYICGKAEASIVGQG